MYTSARRLHSTAVPSQKVLSAWLSMLFLVLPVISRRVCQSFRCNEYNVEGNEYVHYLSADSGIDCSSARYNGMVVFACCMVIIYPLGCPLLLFLMLFKYRGLLNPANMDEHEVADLVLRIAADNHRAGEGKPLVKVDACGVGLGVVSILRQKEGVQVLGVNAADPSSMPDEFPNVRSQLWFAVADWLRDGGSIPKDAQVEALALRKPAQLRAALKG